MPDWIELERKYLFQNYGRQPIVLERGEGSRVLGRRRERVPRFRRRARRYLPWARPPCRRGGRGQAGGAADPRLESLLHDPHDRARRAVGGELLARSRPLLQLRSGGGRDGDQARAALGPRRAQRRSRDHRHGERVPRAQPGGARGHRNGPLPRTVRAHASGIHARPLGRSRRREGGDEQGHGRGAHGNRSRARVA